MANMLNDQRYCSCKECGHKEFYRREYHSLYKEPEQRDSNFYAGIRAPEVNTMYEYVCRNCGAILERGDASSDRL